MAAAVLRRALPRATRVVTGGGPSPGCAFREFPDAVLIWGTLHSRSDLRSFHGWSLFPQKSEEKGQNTHKTSQIFGWLFSSKNSQDKKEEKTAEKSEEKGQNTHKTSQIFGWLFSSKITQDKKEEKTAEVMSFGVLQKQPNFILLETLLKGNETTKNALMIIFNDNVLSKSIQANKTEFFKYMEEVAVGPKANDTDVRSALITKLLTRDCDDAVWKQRVETSLDTIIDRTKPPTLGEAIVRSASGIRLSTKKGLSYVVAIGLSMLGIGRLGHSVLEGARKLEKLKQELERSAAEVSEKDETAENVPKEEDTAENVPGSDEETEEVEDALSEEE